MQKCGRKAFQILNKYLKKNVMKNINLAPDSHTFKNSNARSSTHLKESTDLRFYSSSKDDNLNNTQETTESATLLNEIYKNISCRGAMFNGPFAWRPVIYCDYAASGQSLNFIEDYIRKEVLPFYGNTHTTNTATSSQSTYFRDEAKDIIRKSVNASEDDAVFFTGNGSTSCVNKLIHMLNLKTPIVVFVGPFEHHSNLLPWREISAKVVRIKETESGLVDLKCLETELKIYSGQKYQLIGSFSAASNVTGILTDDKTVSILLHKYHALSFWDYAAAAPYIPIDMNPIVLGHNEDFAYKDAVFISPHKFVGGPDTPGILIAKKNILQNVVPSEPGGGTVSFVSRNTHKYLDDVEMREEGGTPSIVGAIRAGMVFQLKEAVGCSVISSHEEEICKMVFNSWENIPTLKILGNTYVSRLPIFSFLIHHTQSNLYLHHNFVCALLNDLYGIQTRSGCACAGPYALDLLGIDETMAMKFAELLAEDKTFRKLLSPGFTRLTVPFFMSKSDIEFILESVAQVAEHGWKLLPLYSFNSETGEWKNKSRQGFFGRKWLGSVSYKSGYFAMKEDNIRNVKIKSQSEYLEEARSIFSSSSLQEVSREFTTDQKLMFDAESSDLRWFLLPSEAIHYISVEEIQIKDPVFVVRTRFQYRESTSVKSFASVVITDQSLEVDLQAEVNKAIEIPSVLCLNAWQTLLTRSQHNNNKTTH
ncbi:hypothetical protein JTE90_014772 [Oedothorax gibbosus]|uniref:Aminotransferase class V domain-containing protein n=1 Tax=Oedothorax gibbosus TaxID=931172 RepID=A0AAV6UBF2_9ARAC|nr:hypothetical protein JTE90_014772 [Oedothorax gibbosus]